MNKIDQQLAKLKSENRLGFMTHVVVGYPGLPETENIVRTMDDAGVDFIELQIPFSDPLADSFKLASKLSGTIRPALLFMAYYNSVFKFGVDEFCKKASEAGISGLIVPDIPIEEESTEGFMQACSKYGLKHIHVISPSSTEARLIKNAAIANGFIYCTARQGITDAKKGLDPQIAGYLKNVRNHFSTPVAVGFGISNRERVDMIRDYADIAVVGSAIIDIIDANPENYSDKIKQFLSTLTGPGNQK